MPECLTEANIKQGRRRKNGKQRGVNEDGQEGRDEQGGDDTFNDTIGDDGSMFNQAPLSLAEKADLEMDLFLRQHQWLETEEGDGVANQLSIPHPPSSIMSKKYNESLNSGGGGMRSDGGGGGGEGQYMNECYTNGDMSDMVHGGDSEEEDDNDDVEDVGDGEKVGDGSEEEEEGVKYDDGIDFKREAFNIDSKAHGTLSIEQQSQQSQSQRQSQSQVGYQSPPKSIHRISPIQSPRSSQNNLLSHTSSPIMSTHVKGTSRVQTLANMLTSFETSTPEKNINQVIENNPDTDMTLSETHVNTVQNNIQNNINNNSNIDNSSINNSPIAASYISSRPNNGSIEPWERFDRARMTEEAIGSTHQMPFFDLSSTNEKYGLGE